MPGAPFQQSHVIQRAGIRPIASACSTPACRAVFLPRYIGKRDVGIAVLIVGPQLDYLVESRHGVGVLELIEIGDAQIIPAHPVGIVSRIRRRGLILAEIQRACPRGEFHHGISRMIRTQNIVEIALAQMPVVDARGDRERPLGAGRNAELIRTSVERPD